MPTTTERPDVRYLVGAPRGGSRAVITHCPNPEHDDRKPSYAVYADGGYCFSCGFKETPEQIIERLDGNPGELPQRPKDRERRYRGYVKDFRAQELLGSVQLWHQTLMEGPRKHRLGYLVERGIGRNLITTQMLGHDGKHFVIPIWHPTEDGVLTGMRLRRDDDYWLSEDDPDYPKYRNPYAQPAQLVYRPRPGGRPFVICEGELDALALAQYGVDAITCTGGVLTLPQVFSRERRDDRYKVPGGTIFIATDLDEAGDTAAEKLKRVLGGDVRRVRWEAGKDVSEALMLVSLSTRARTLRQWFTSAQR